MGRMGLGRNSYARKDYVKAIEQYNRIIALNPDYSSGYSFRAEAYLAKGEKSAPIISAIEIRIFLYEFAPLGYGTFNIAGFSQNIRSFTNLALDRKDDAIAFMEKVIANDSINPGNYYDAACFTCRLGDREKFCFHH